MFSNLCCVENPASAKQPTLRLSQTDLRIGWKVAQACFAELKNKAEHKLTHLISARMAVDTKPLKVRNYPEWPIQNGLSYLRNNNNLKAYKNLVDSVNVSLFGLSRI